MEIWKTKKILVAEDEMLNFMIISALLEDTGIEITHADNGKLAVEYCLKGHFDILFMDLNMPYLDGFEALKEIKQNDNKIIVIAQTAYAFKRDECLQAGFDDFIIKPYSQEQLMDIFSKFLDI